MKAVANYYRDISNPDAKKIRRPAGPLKGGFVKEVI
jgi:hypothetical protein